MGFLEKISSAYFTPRAPMGSHGFPWVPMGSHGFPWVPIGSHGFPWVPMGSHGFPKKDLAYSVQSFPLKHVYK